MIASARAARLLREVRMFETKPPWGITCFPAKEDVYDHLTVTLLGPKGTPYERGSFKLTITIPSRYPFEPPLVKFVTPIYHPNIDRGGRICMDMLKMPPKGAWLPTITLETLLVSLQTLLANPNPDDPLMMDIATEYKFNIEKFHENAKKYTEKYAVLTAPSKVQNAGLRQTLVSPSNQPLKVTTTMETEVSSSTDLEYEIKATSSTS